MSNNAFGHRVPAGHDSKTDQISSGAAFGVTNLESDRPIGHLMNITADELHIQTWKSIEIDATYNFRVRLPETIGGSNFIIMNAKCLRCTQQDATDSFDVGFKISGLTTSNARRIGKLMAMLNPSGKGARA